MEIKMRLKKLFVILPVLSIAALNMRAQMPEISVSNLPNVIVKNGSIVMNCQQDFPVLKGDYLGQKKPGLIPELFAPGLLSTKEHSAIGLAFTPDGKELYYTSWGGEPRARIMYMKRESTRWSKPQTAPFSGKYMDWDLNLSPDGNKLFFNSRRPVKENGEPKEDADIWLVERTKNGWSEPENLGSPVNTDKNEVHPTVSRNGTLYFFAQYDDSRGSADIYRSKLVNGQYTQPENLGDAVNSEFPEMDPFVAPDESYLIFHSPRPDGFGQNDLYISFRAKDGTWSEAINMGTKINTQASEYCGRVSPDGKYFFFSIRKESPANFYWVDAKIINELKPDNLK